MDVLQSLFRSGAIIDLILLLIVVEAVGLLAWRRVTGAGVAPRALLPFLAAGVCLMLAVKFALAGQNWILIALALAGAFVFHLTDIALRWQGPGSGRSGEERV